MHKHALPMLAVLMTLLAAVTLWSGSTKLFADLASDRVLFHSTVTQPGGALLSVGKQNFFECPGTVEFSLLSGALAQDNQASFLIYEYVTRRIDPRAAVYPSNGWLARHAWVGEQFPLMRFKPGRMYYVWTTIPLRMQCGIGLFRAESTGSSVNSVHSSASSMKTSSQPSSSTSSSSNRLCLPCNNACVFHDPAQGTLGCPALDGVQCFIENGECKRQLQTSSVGAMTASSALSSSSQSEQQCNNFITVGNMPQKAAISGSKAYVLNYDSVSVVDVHTGIPIKTHAVKYIPTHIAIVGSRVYVGSKKSGSSAWETALTVIDDTTNEILSSEEGGPAGPFVVAGTTLYALQGRSQMSTLLVKNALTNTTIKQIPGIDGESDMILSGSNLILHGSYAIDRIDTQTNTVTTHVDLDYRNPRGLAVIGGKVYAAGWHLAIVGAIQQSRGFVDAVDLTTGTVQRMITVNVPINTMAAVGTKLYVLLQGTVQDDFLVVDTTTSSELSRSNLGLDPGEILVRGNQVFIRDNNTSVTGITVVDGATDHVTGTIAIGTAVTSMTETVEGILVTSSKIGTGKLHVLNPQNLKLRSYCEEP